MGGKTEGIEQGGRAGAGWFFAGQRLLVVCGMVGIAGYVATVVTYLFSPSFLDHVEPALACVAALFFGGELQLYPLDPNVAPHAQHYGPMFFVWPATMIELTGDAILGPKLVSTTAPVVALALIGWVAARETRRWDIAVLVAGLLAWWFLRMGYVTYWARPDGQILVPAAVAVLSATLRSNRWSAVLLGVCIGFTAGIKINAFVGLLPLAGFLWHKAGLKALMIAGLAAAVTVLAPFLLPQVSLAGYLQCLGYAAGHGISPEKLMRLNWILPVLLTPLGIVATAAWIRNRTALHRELRRYWVFWIALLPCLFVEMIFAAKHGSGSSQLIVLLPVLAYALSRLLILVLGSPGWGERGVEPAACRSIRKAGSTK